MTTTKNLDETFNIAPTEVVEADEVKPPVGIQKPDRLTKNDIEKDYEYTRGNLYSIIEKGQEAINGILELAQDSEMPRAYEVTSSSVWPVSFNILSFIFIPLFCFFFVLLL